MAANDKDTIYIDIDDEITGIIDKLQGSDAKVVALVLPKRASVFQSIVNMKLLKRAADGAHKNIVLITSEPGLLPLAGAAGVHVAKTLTSKPEIPVGPDMSDEDEEVGENDGLSDEEKTAETDGDVPVGELAGAAAVGAIAGAAVAKKVGKDDIETLELADDELPADNQSTPPAGPKTFDPPKDKKGKVKKDKKLKVPDFNRFRTWLILGGIILVALIVAAFFAIKVLPKATINITTNAVAVDVNQPLVLSTTAKTLDTSTNTLPAKNETLAKTYTQSAATTGQKNNGNKASGNVALLNCSKNVGDLGIPAGTGLSSGGNTYITQSAVTLPESSFNGGGKCTSTTKINAPVLAQSGGASYNLPSGASFTVAGFSGVSGTGETISGGTDSIVQSVNQNDINTAKAKIVVDDPGVKKTLQESLTKAGYYPIPETYTASTPVVTTSAKVGDVTNSVTVNEAVTYTMFGVHKSDLQTLVEANVKSQIDTSKQSILSDGLARATFNIENATATTATLSMTTTATVGPDLDTQTIINDAIGKKSGDVKNDLEHQPGVKSVTVSLSPFWVSSVPNKPTKVKVIIAKPAASAKASSNATNP